MKRRWAIMIVAGALAFATMPHAGATAASPRWVRETGNGYAQYGTGVAVDDAGNAWVVGVTTGPFPKAADPVSRRASTAFLAKYNVRGGLTSSTQFGTASSGAQAIARDAAGNLDIVGWTFGPGEFPGTTDANAGASDAFVRRYDADGNHLWTHLLGSSESDVALGVAEDHDGNVYVVGETEGHIAGAAEPDHFSGDGWIAKYGPDGTRAWVHQIGTDREEEITGVAVAAGGGVDVVGGTSGALAGDGSNQGNWDVFVAHYGVDGTRAWLKQFGSATPDVGEGIASDANGNLYVVGVTSGALAGWTGRTEFYGDAFLLKLDSSGAPLAIRQFGAKGRDVAHGVTVDAGGDVYVTGDVDQHLAGAPEANAGSADAFVARYAPTDTGDGLRRAWVHEVGSLSRASGAAVAASSTGVVTMAGDSEGRIDTAPRYRGGPDALVVRFNRVS